MLQTREVQEVRELQLAAPAKLNLLPRALLPSHKPDRVETVVSVSRESSWRSESSFSAVRVS